MKRVLCLLLVLTLCIPMLTGVASAAANNGWAQENGQWVYYKQGAKATGWHLINNKWYYMNAQGIMLTGWQLVGNTWYFLKSSGEMATGWLQQGTTWYYLGANGGMATGWLTLGATRYYFQSSGAMAEGECVIDGVTHIFAASGAWIGEAAAKHGWVRESGVWRYYDNGVAVTGWKKIGGYWYYFNAQGNMITGWLQLGANWYYMKPAGDMVTGVFTIGNVQHLFNGDGVWQGEYVQLRNGWTVYGGRWQYYENGSAVKGWKRLVNIWYYFDAEGYMCVGWKQVGNYWYYFDSEGAMVTGWQRLGSYWYYFDNLGAMKTGWFYYGGCWYYFYTDGRMATNVYIDGGYIGSDGVWREVSSNTRYGGHLNVRTTARPTGVDPMKQTGAWKYMWTTAVYEPFLTRDADNQIQPCVCDYVMIDYTDSAGRLHNELWIWPRDGYTFSQGYGQVEIEDIEASFDRGLNQYANIKKYVKPNIDASTNNIYQVSDLPASVKSQILAKDSGVTKVFHIDFTYHEKNLYYFATYRTWWPVMPKEICSKYATSYLINQLDDAVGTGPYYFSDFKDSLYVEITKRDDYTPVDNSQYSGMAGTKYGYMDSMIFWYNTTDASAALAVLAGDYDVTNVVPEEYQGMFEQAGLATTTMETDQRAFIFFNTNGTNNVVAKYPSLRKAIMAAIDYDTYLANVADGPVRTEGDNLMLDERYDVDDKFKSADYYGAYNQAIVDKYMNMARVEGYKGEPIQIPMHTGRTDIPTWTAYMMERAGINYELYPMDYVGFSAFIADPSNNWDFYFSTTTTAYTPGTLSDTLVKYNFKSDRVLEIREELMFRMDPTSDVYLALWDEWTDIWVEECQVGYLGEISWEWWHPSTLNINDDGEARYFYNTYWDDPLNHPYSKW